MPFADRSAKTGPLLTPVSGQVTESGAAFPILQSQTGVAITDLNFNSSDIGSFHAQIFVYIDATTTLGENFMISGVWDGSDWCITTTSVTCVETGVVFDITSGGQITYTSGTWAGFVSGYLLFKVDFTRIV